MFYVVISCNDFKSNLNYIVLVDFMDLILKSESLAATAIALMLNFHKGLFNPLDGPRDLL